MIETSINSFRINECAAPPIPRLLQALSRLDHHGFQRHFSRNHGIGGAVRMFLPKDTKTEGKKAGFLNMVPSAKSYDESFVPIAPGRYVITKVQCTIGGMTNLEGGYDDDWLFKHVTPFTGASTITIGEGQIIDAGYAHFQGKRSEPTVVASEASATEREFMKKLIPEVYPAITFTEFGN